MTTYTKITDYASKDALLTGNPSKVVRGTEIDAEFTAIASADADSVKTSALGTGVATFLATPSSENLAAAVTGETGSGALVFGTSPTLVTPALGTPSALVGTNITGTAAGLTAGNVTTNANLTGHVTSVGNAAVLGSFTIAQLNTAISDANAAILAANTFTGAQNFARATVASHATTADIWGAAGNQIDWTGTATTTAFPAAPQAGAERVLICAGACSFTAGANMLIDGVASAATVTCAANDTMIVRAVSTTQFKISRVKYDGTPQVSGSLGAMVYLSTVTAAAAATADIETGFSSTYDDYVIIGEGIYSSSSSTQLLARFKLTGAYVTTSSYRSHVNISNEGAATYAGASSVNAGAGTLSGTTSLSDGSGGNTLRFTAFIHDVNSSNKKSVRTVGSEFVNGGFCDAHTQNPGTGVLSGIRLYASTGNITGTFKLYGIAKS